VNQPIITSPDLTPAQLASLEHKFERHSKTRFAILPGAIPVDKVVGLDRVAGSVTIEFAAFGNIPAGSVRINRSDDNWRDLPVLVRPESTVEHVSAVARAHDKTSYIARIDEDVTLLMNESTLHEAKYLGDLKESLEAKLARGDVLEREPAFMEFSAYELERARWTDALAAWLDKHPYGLLVQLQSNVNAVAEVMLMRYRDEYRINRRADVQAGIAMKLAEPMFSWVRPALAVPQAPGKQWAPGHTIRTACENGRISYHPEWSSEHPWVSYWCGSAGLHFATPELAAGHFKAKHNATLLVSAATPASPTASEDDTHQPSTRRPRMRR
jgi:hypothetical protein